MGRKLAVAISACAFVLGLVAAAGQGAAQPDSGFGRDGRVLLPGRIETGSGTVLLPNGRILLAGSKRLVALDPSGKIDHGFGTDGFVRPFGPPGSSSARIMAIAADSRQRIVVVASCGCRPSDGGPAGSFALIARFTPGGQLDPSFGGGDGILATNLGLPASVEDPGDPTYEAPVETFVRSAVVDSSDRIVLGGERARSHFFYKGHLFGRFEAFVGRLTPDGEVDRSFARNGVITLPEFEEIGRLAADDGGLYFSVASGGRGTLVHLRADGEPDSGFGENGGRPVPRKTEGGLVLLDGSGNLLLAGDLRASRKRGLPGGIAIKRLRPDGSLDQGFGRGGLATLRLPRFESGVLAADPRGGVLVAASSSSEPHASAGMQLARLRSNGSLDRGFGRRGVVEIPFQSEESGLQSVIISGSKALLSGYWCHRGRCGGALARIGLGPG